MLNIQKNTGLTFDDVLIVPKYSVVTSRSQAKTNTNLTSDISLDIPFIASPMDTVSEIEMAIAMNKLGGSAVLHRYVSIQQQIQWVKDLIKLNITPVAAVGASGEDKTRLNALVAAGLTTVVIDVANGDSIYSHEMIKWAKKNYPRLKIIAGNVATADGFSTLQAIGADAVRVGIGGGSLCSTRIVAGIGVPQLTAIADCAEVAEVPLIADGGIRTGSDVAKAIGAGADTVMLGGTLIGCDESPGELMHSGHVSYKLARGMASREAQESKAASMNQDINLDKIVPEGVTAYVQYSGSVESVIQHLNGGLKSAMTYVNAVTLKEFRTNIEFIRITNAGLKESHPHIKGMK